MNHQRGSAYVIVMVFCTLSLLVVMGLVSIQLSYRQAFELHERRIQADLLCQSGMAVAKAQLHANPDWTGQAFYPMPEGSSLSLQVRQRTDELVEIQCHGILPTGGGRSEYILDDCKRRGCGIVANAAIKNIILVGLTGSGKSSVGHALAAHLGWQFVDTDEWIEKEDGRTIAEIFAQEGEKYFRQKEQLALQTLLPGDRQVVATGGGIVLSPENRSLMKKYGLVVTLYATMDELLLRLRGDQKRPLLQGDLRDQLQALIQQRSGMYDFAHIQVNTTGKSLMDIVGEITRHLATDLTKEDN